MNGDQVARAARLSVDEPRGRRREFDVVALHTFGGPDSGGEKFVFAVIPFDGLCGRRITAKYTRSIGSRRRPKVD